ncbi:MAG: phosphoenolpyruvate synthase, partial [Bacteroidetes bacterium]
MTAIRRFSEIKISDIASVGGKNASLGEMYSALSSKGIAVPDGFAVTSEGYQFFLKNNNLKEKISGLLDKLDTSSFTNLSEIGAEIRRIIMNATFPKELEEEILSAYRDLNKNSETVRSLAVRSSATAEDLPNASFAGQQESYLNVNGEVNLIKACHRCYASLFTDRAIKYRYDNGFEHMKVSLSIGVQFMVRSDLACSGVMFTMDPDSGWDKVVLVSGAWGLGENVVQGSVNTDEFLVYKPFIDKVSQPIISRKLGSKNKTMVFSVLNENDVVKPEDAVINTDTTEEKSNTFILDDSEVVQLAKWAELIREHYNCHMDIEWAKDGADGKLYIVQARPETVHSGKVSVDFKQYKLLEKGQEICSGAGLGNKIVYGKARILHSPSDSSKLQEGEILVTERTDPDWDPLLKKAAAIITNQGGRTSHAAIVAREVGSTAVVGTIDGTEKIKDGQMITVSTAVGTTGIVYDGKLKWEEKVIDITSVPKTRTKAMLILAHPDEAYRYSLLPNDGVGLMRMEFIISNAIGIHP